MNTKSFFHPTIGKTFIAIAALAASTTASWAVSANARENIAVSIRDDSHITLLSSHVSGVVDNANVRQNIVDTAKGLQAARSSYGTAPGGKVWLDPRMLDCISKLSKTYGYTFRITEIAGGSHSAGSYHYSGVAFDVDMINGIPVNSSSSGTWQTFQNRCAAMGSTENLNPFNASGHETHIHMAWTPNSGNVAPNTIGPDAVSWGSGRIDVVVRGANNDIFHKSYVSGSGWSSYENLGGNAQSSPSICSWGSGRLDVFARGGDNTLIHKWYVSGSGWSGWESLGGTLTSGPDAVSWASGRIDVVIRGSNNNLFHKYYQSGSGWSSYDNLGGDCTSEPSICSWGSGRLDVFVRSGSADALYHKSFSSGWSGWENLGGTLTSAPDAVCWASGRIDIVARSIDCVMYHKYYQSGSGFSGWENISGSSTSCPGISSWGSGRLDVFIRGINDSLWHKFFGPTWGSWEDLGGSLQ